MEAPVKSIKANLKELMKEIQENPEKLNDLNEEQVRELRKGIIPYSHITGLTDKFTVFTLTNLEAEYMKRLVCMAFSGFIYKMLEEFDLEEHPNLDETFKDVDMAAFSRQTRGFLGTVFEYNPEDHVRPLKMENAKSVADLSKAKREELKIPMPPADTLLRFNRYLDNHFEQLRDITTTVYQVNPIIEDAIQIMGTFDTEEAAKEFREKYQDDFTSQIRILQHGAWGMTGPWEQNRDKTEFLNEHTQFLKEVIDRMDQDEKLGADMMRKRIKKLKKRDIQKTGPDPKSLGQYATATGKKLDKLGAERVELTEEEHAAIEKANNKVPVLTTKSNETDQSAKELLKHGDIISQNFEEDDECPDDAVEVNVVEISKGGKNVQSSKFYTEMDGDDVIKKHASEIQKTFSVPSGAPPGDRTAKTKSKVTVPNAPAKSSKLTLGSKK